MERGEQPQRRALRRERTSSPRTDCSRMRAGAVSALRKSSKSRTLQGVNSHHSSPMPCLSLRTTYAVTARTSNLLDRAAANVLSIRASAGTLRFVLIHAPLRLKFEIISAPIAYGRTESRTGILTCTRSPHRCSTTAPWLSTGHRMLPRSSGLGLYE